MKSFRYTRSKNNIEATVQKAFEDGEVSGIAQGLQTYKGLVATDFDDTLAACDSSISPKNLKALSLLGNHGYARTVITGRSLVSFLETAGHELPIDFVGFSTGIGIYDYKNQKILKHYHFSSQQTVRLGFYLYSLNYDFMAHLPVPKNHRFLYYDTGRGKQWYFTCGQSYNDYAQPLESPEALPSKASQFVIIDPPNTNLLTELEKNLQHCTIIRTTSPFDGKSLWIDLFPENVHKGSTLNWLTSILKLSPKHVLAIGNDYNDLHMLQNAGTGVVVANAPEPMKKKFYVVRENHKGGFNQAVKEWLRPRI